MAAILPPKRAPRASSRTALLDAALLLVRKQGWTASTVEQLCATAHVTKGAFFHHFPSKQALGVAAAQHWSEVTATVFANADYHRLRDPLSRVLGYLDLRSRMVQGPLEAFSCFAGTVTQEVFATSEPIRAAAGESIFRHATTLVADFQATIDQYAPKTRVTAQSLAIYTQTTLQGGFVLAKAHGSADPLLDAIAHLKRYVTLLFTQELGNE